KGRTEHMGIHPQKQDGLCYIGFPCFPGLMSGEQMIQVAQVLREFGQEFRITREQNFILTDIPEAKVDTVVARIADIGYPLNVNRIRGASIGCTGEPHCNFSVGETKPKVVEIVDRLEARFGEQIKGLHLYVDGCPHACGQHWVGDIGLQGTTRSTDTGKVQAYDIILRGGLGPGAEIGLPLLRRVPRSGARAAAGGAASGGRGARGARAGGGARHAHTPKGGARPAPRRGGARAGARGGGAGRRGCRLITAMNASEIAVGSIAPAWEEYNE